MPVLSLDRIPKTDQQVKKGAKMSGSDDFKEFQVLLKEEAFLSLKLQIKSSESEVLISEMPRG